MTKEEFYMKAIHEFMKDCNQFGREEDVPLSNLLYGYKDCPVCGSSCTSDE